MDKKALNLVILEDNPDDVVLILKELKRDGFIVKCNKVETKKAFKEALAEKPDIILSDYQIPSFNGKAALQIRQKLSPDIPMIIVSGSVDKKDAIECMKCGAVDYVLKENLSQLGKSVNRALKEADERLQRRQAEEKIKTSEERFRILFESAKDGFFLIDKNWKYIDVNPAYCRMFGYTRDEFLKSDMMIVLFLYDIEKVFEDGKSIGKDKYFFPEYRMRKKDRSEIWVNLTITPFYSAGEELMLGIISDVTKRKRTEEALRESEELFRTIVETAPSFLTITDEKGDNIYISPNCEEITGYTQEELHGKWIWSVHEDDTLIAKELFDKTFSDGIGYKNFEYKFLTKKGELRYASSSWEPLKDKEGKFKGIVFQTIDVTERKLAVEKLIENEEKYRNLVENIQDGVFIIQDGKFRFVNEAFAKIPGYTVKEIIGMDYYKLVAPEDLDMVEDRYVRMMAGEDVPMEYEFRGIRKKGDEQSIVYMNVGLVNYQGKKAALGTLKDITERKRAEEKLIKSEEKYRTLIETMKEGIITVDKNENITFVNQAACGIFEYSQKELLVKNLKELTTPEEFRKIIKKTSIRKSGKSDIYELSIIRKDGEARIISVSASPVSGSDGKYQGSFGIFHDITERKRAEDNLIESEEKYRQLAETAKDIILLSDLKGNVKYVNSEGLRNAGYSEKEALQMNVMDMLTKDCIPATKERFIQRRKGINDIFVYDAEFLNKKGYKIPIEVKSNSY
jgi:PAS domain S-box-containing protein